MRALKFRGILKLSLIVMSFVIRYFSHVKMYSKVKALNFIWKDVFIISETISLCHYELVITKISGSQIALLLAMILPDFTISCFQT